MLNCLFVGIGGFAGAICRYLMGMIPLQDKSGFPWITLCMNAIGAFVIGLVTAAAAKNGWGDSHLVLFLKTGVCGGFTTFSTFALESSSLMKQGKTGTAAVYMVLSVGICLAMVMLGQKLIVK